MKKFVVLYRVPVEVMQKWRQETPPEEMQKQGKELGEKMMAWMQTHDNAIVDKGMPLGKNMRLTASGLEEVSNDLNAYVVIEADSAEEVAKIFEGNPHLEIPTAYLDIMEVPHR